MKYLPHALVILVATAITSTIITIKANKLPPPLPAETPTPVHVERTDAVSPALKRERFDRRFLERYGLTVVTNADGSQRVVADR